MENTQRRVGVIGGVRIPFCRNNTAYADVGNFGMSVKVLGALVERFGLHGVELGEVAMGAVIKHPSDWNLAREALLSSGLAPTTPGITTARACGTSLDNAIIVANKIALGQIEAGIAGGTDTTSDAPLQVNDEMRRTLLELNRARSLTARLKAAAKLRPLQPFRPEIPRNAEPRTGLSMGEHAAITARRWDIAREAQDELALASHQRLAAAYDRGFFDDLVTPYLGLTRDQNLRADTSLEKLSSLKTVYGREDATMTAGNSSPLTDGASTVLLASEQWAAERSLPVQAWMVDCEVAAVDFVHGDEGLLMAPAYAVPRMLARRGLSLRDFDYYEIHEAFASQVLATLEAWESAEFCKQRLGLEAPLGPIDRDKLNVNGSSLAAGHPFAATGGRIVANAAKLLKANGGGRALISVCAAGGQGVVAILEA